FTYTQDKQPDTRAEWSEVRKTVFSAQAGAGFDFLISAPSNTTQMSLSPFISFQTDIGREPRSVESWSFYTVRTGVAFKFGNAKKPVPVKEVAESIVEKEVEFSVRAPKIVPAKRKVRETIALRNSVFFDMGATNIPSRYVALSSSQAVAFRENQLQSAQPDNLNKGRSSRQMLVYHNILNIMGDRLRSHPQSTITLTGASANNPSEGRMMAENVKQYLVNVFGIDASRITTEGRDKPLIPSEQPGATKELALLHAGDRRVDIVSNSPELLLQVGGKTESYLKPVEIVAIQEDPLDSHVIFTAAGANDLLSSWDVVVTDQNGMIQKYGPYTKDQASVSGKTILGNKAEGNFKVAMIGQTKSGVNVRKESAISIKKVEDTKQEGLRYSILFDFDQSKSIASYEKFLTEIITPLIPENGMVMIHGHTDIIGEEMYNYKLSYERALGVQQIIERALLQAGKKGVTFETYGFGQDTVMAPFENNLPEERFYNRTVIIDIIPAK
ncbi:MAG: OmpA family protein, partial [Chitinophagaceae bacterium]